MILQAKFDERDFQEWLETYFDHRVTADIKEWKVVDGILVVDFEIDL